MKSSISQALEVSEASWPRVQRLVKALNDLGVPCVCPRAEQARVVVSISIDPRLRAENPQEESRGGQGRAIGQTTMKRTFELSILELGYLLGALRTLARQKCKRSNCGTVCLCDPCAARKVLPIFDQQEARTEAPKAQVIDLMAALKASLAAKPKQEKGDQDE